MLQTTKNQLTITQIVSKHRQMITNILINEGYIIANDSLDLDECGSFATLISRFKSPIQVVLDIERCYMDDGQRREEIFIEFNNDWVNRYYQKTIYCDEFTSEDIQAITELYLHMLKNNTTTTPSVIKSLTDEDILEPGQLAEIISEYSTKEKN